MKKYFFALLLLTACATDARYTLHEDNDIFKPEKTKDRDFSQGLRLSREHKDPTGSTEVYVGQNFYTPGHKQLIEYQPDDRPYSGFLYTGASFKYRTSSTVQDTLGITTGIIGPHSYSEQAQNEVHRFLDQRTAKGWDNQIHDELGLMLTAERAVAVPFNQNFDLVNTFGGNLGNVYTQGYVGSLVRYGYGLPDAFTTGNIIYPRGTQFLDPEKWSLYLYMGPWARAVLQNIFLDGNTFRDSASIGKRPLVLEGRLGFGIEYDQYRFAYTYIIQTSEYDGQPTGNDFGELTFSVGF